MICNSNKIEILTNGTNLCILSILAPRYFYGQIILILCVSIVFLTSILKPVHKWSDSYFVSIKIFYIISKILLILGLFIIIDNVFVMRNGFKNCNGCVIVTDKSIILCSLILALYVLLSSYMIFFCDVQNKK